MSQITISIGRQSRRDLLRTAAQFVRLAIRAGRPSKARHALPYDPDGEALAVANN